MTDITPGLMEAVIDWVVDELSTFSAASEADGGIADAVHESGVTETLPVFWGDPGVIAVTNYPCWTVAPMRGQPMGGTTGTVKRDLSVLITFLIDGREYFELDPEEANGDRLLVRVADRLETWMERKTKSRLDGLPGVHSAEVSGTEYTPQPRGSVFAKSAELVLTVNRSRQRGT